MLGKDGDASGFGCLGQLRGINLVCAVGIGTTSNEAEWCRPYEIFAHADARLLGEPNEFARADAVTGIKRAVEHRVRALHAKYAFRNIPIRDKPSDRLELLQWVGLIRPTMLRKLVDIRNAVEHEDAVPPDSEACRVLADFAWFFLRATDRLIQHVASHVVLDSDPRVSPAPY